MLRVTALDLVTFISLAMCWSLAVVLWRASIRGSVGRRLAVLLVVEGMALATSGWIASLFGASADIFARYPPFATIAVLMHAFADCWMLVLYPPFLAMALKTPWTRIFGDKRVQWGLAAVVALLYAGLALPLFKVLGTPAVPDYDSLAVPTGLLYAGLTVLFVFAFATSLYVWHTSSGMARKRARIFAIAFGSRDICWGFIYGSQIWYLWNANYEPVFLHVPPLFIFYPLGTLVAVPLIAYGILRSQLFDIDLRIRWTIKQSTLAGAVVAIVYVMSEGASRLLSDELGNIAGLLAAAVVVFFLAPLQRFADRIAQAAMPNTHDTPEYAAFRKLQVYEAAIGDALPGGISDKERALLHRLQESLGISDADAASIERDLEAKTQQKGGREHFRFKPADG